MYESKSEPQGNLTGSAAVWTPLGAATPSGRAVAERARETCYLRRLGERVRQMRTERNCTRRALSRQSGVSERFIAQIEAGRGNVSILRLRQIARALDVPVADIVTETDGAAAADDVTLPATARHTPIDALIRRADPCFQKAVIDLVLSDARRRGAG
ncbi:MAG: hypothetical protein AcusKO_46120 [Acuticoccus sp.]